MARDRAISARRHTNFFPKESEVSGEQRNIFFFCCKNNFVVCLKRRKQGDFDPSGFDLPFLWIYLLLRYIRVPGIEI